MHRLPGCFIRVHSLNWRNPLTHVSPRWMVKLSSLLWSSELSASIGGLSELHEWRRQHERMLAGADTLDSTLGFESVLISYHQYRYCIDTQDTVSSISISH